jgi:hypothetical protein
MKKDQECQVLDGCKEKAVFFMCDRHWRMVPKALKDFMTGHLDRDPDRLSTGCRNALGLVVEYVFHREKTRGHDWKTIVGYENLYEINQYGQIRTVGSKALMTWEVNSSFYPQVKLKNKWHRVHVLVARTFHGPCPKGHEIWEVNHEDGHKMKPHASTLAYRTKKQNGAHRDETGLCKHPPRSKEEVETIRETIQHCFDTKGTVPYTAGAVDFSTVSIRRRFQKLAGGPAKKGKSLNRNEEK